MTDLDKMARELLAAEYGKAGSRRFAEDLRSGCDIGDSDTAYAVQAIRAALLAAPPGWKLVPVEPTEEMETANAMYGDTSDWWNAVITAAPEVK